jgi:hypothetical protein
MQDGEQTHDLDVGPGDLGQPKPVLQGPSPVGDPVIAIPR